MRTWGFSFLLLGIQRKANSVKTIRKGNREGGRRERIRMRSGGGGKKQERKLVVRGWQARERQRQRLSLAGAHLSLSERAESMSGCSGNLS